MGLKYTNNLYKNMKKIILLLITIFLITGCVANADNINRPVILNDYKVNNIIVEEFMPHDNILCFVSYGYNSGGISCLIVE